MEIYNFISLVGAFVILSLAYLISKNRQRIDWHITIWMFGFQLLIGWFLFVAPAGLTVLQFINSFVNQLLSASQEGARFLFGSLTDPSTLAGVDGEGGIGFILAFQALPSVIFFSALMAILYFWGVMAWIIRQLAAAISKVMSLSGAEALCAVSNLFVGIESVFTIRPYLSLMTRSEMFLVLTAGMSTIASNVLAIYVFQLQDDFTNISAHLVSASLLSVPASIAIAKIMEPETETPQTLGVKAQPKTELYAGVFDAIIDGAMQGVRIIVGIAAVLIAVLGLLDLVDMIVSSLSLGLSGLWGQSVELSLSLIFSWLLYPLMLLIGIPPVDAPLAAELMGQRFILTEVVSYQNLALFIQEHRFKEPRSIFLISYALCGFAHFASLAIFSGGVIAIAPKQRALVSRLGIRSLIAATLACLLTAAVAGIFFVRQSILLAGSL